MAALSPGRSHKKHERVGSWGQVVRRPACCTTQDGRECAPFAESPVIMRDWLLPLAIVLAAIIFALATRYEPMSQPTAIMVLDRWTGCFYAPMGKETFRRCPP